MAADPGMPEFVLASAEQPPEAPKPTVMSVKPKKEPSKVVPDPDRLLMTAKRVVVENYNQFRDAERTQELTMNAVYIIWFTKVLGSWRAIVGSPIAHGLMWDVTFNSYKNETYIDVYKKLNKVKLLPSRS